MLFQQKLKMIISAEGGGGYALMTKTVNKSKPFITQQNALIMHKKIFKLI
jgi:hypothetical protein